MSSQSAFPLRRLHRTIGTFLSNVLLTGLLLAVMLPTGQVVAADDHEQGAKAIYERLCVDCHGAEGQGDDDAGTVPFAGAHSLADLTRIIDETMPEDDPDSCKGPAAQAAAKYIYETFFFQQAQARLAEARIDLSRLTVRQYENAIADLMGTFLGETPAGSEQGLKASYYNAKNFNREKRVIERIDPRVAFDFQEQSPEEGKIGNEEFAIQWRGSVRADETGDYEFCVTTENGVKLWVNDLQKPLLDAWVASGGLREHRVSIRLLGGRSYPLRLDHFKFKSKTASVKLTWIPPHRAEEVIPSRNLSPNGSSTTCVINTVFPADDSSTGYERGNTVSQAWKLAVINAAIEVAGMVVDDLDRLAKTKADAADRREKVQQFCHRFAERAFRRPLSDDQRRLFVDQFFESDESLEKATKKVILLVLQSPRFLYLGINNTQYDVYLDASRMSFALWDSLPDALLLESAQAGQLHTPEQVTAHARRMLTNPRSQAKLRYFLHGWLNIDHQDDISKDPDRYQGFDDAVASSLRTSLDLFLDNVIWNGNADFRSLLLADYWYVNQPLADYYGIGIEPGEQFQEVTSDSEVSAGILTHPYLMARFAYHKTSSPIHRGVFVVRSLLGRFLKPPPIAVAPLDEGADPTLTTRQRVMMQTNEPTCQTCHSMINPLGFSFENYDAVGRFREQENAQPIDASGAYQDREGKRISFNGARGLAEFLAGSRETHRCFVEQLFHSVAKQPVNAYGPDTMDQLLGAFAESEFNVRELLVAIVTTTALGTNKE